MNLIHCNWGDYIGAVIDCVCLAFDYLLYLFGGDFGDTDSFEDCDSADGPADDDSGGNSFVADFSCQSF